MGGTVTSIVVESKEVLLVLTVTNWSSVVRILDKGSYSQCRIRLVASRIFVRWNFLAIPNMSCMFPLCSHGRVVGDNELVIIENHLYGLEGL